MDNPMNLTTENTEAIDKRANLFKTNRMKQKTSAWLVLFAKLDLMKWSAMPKKIAASPTLRACLKILINAVLGVNCSIHFGVRCGC
jgi:hypothetical protein